MTKKQAIAILIQEVKSNAFEFIESNDPEYAKVKKAIEVLEK